MSFPTPLSTEGKMTVIEYLRQIKTSGWNIETETIAPDDAASEAEEEVLLTVRSDGWSPYQPAVHVVMLDVEGDPRMAQELTEDDMVYQDVAAMWTSGMPLYIAFPEENEARFHLIKAEQFLATPGNQHVLGSENHLYAYMLDYDEDDEDDDDFGSGDDFDPENGNPDPGLLHPVREPVTSVLG